jgi:broad specificity phosphatase PhoE
MKKIEYRRHTKRKRPHPNINQKGVKLARKVGKKMGKFDLVVTSSLPRAYETAIAMGYAVDRQYEILGDMPEEAFYEIDYEFGSFMDFAKAVWSGNKLSQATDEQVELFKEIAQELPDEGKALVIGHGGIAETTIIRCLPADTDYKKWGGKLGLCEGVRLYYENGNFVKGKLLRVKKEKK